MDAASNVAFSDKARPVFPLATPMTLDHATAPLSTTAIEIPGRDTRSMNRGSMSRNASDGIHAFFSTLQGDARRGRAVEIAAATASGAVDRIFLRLICVGLTLSRVTC